jgi:hypothetical protein
MTNIRDLPVELFLIIRSFLVEGLRISKEEEGTTSTTSRVAELSWTWTNFLSTSNHEVWRLIRKRTMIWSLNYCEVNACRGSGLHHHPISDDLKDAHKTDTFNSIIVKNECIKDFLFSYSHITALRLPNYIRSLNNCFALSNFSKLTSLTLSEYNGGYFKVQLPSLSTLSIKKGISGMSLESFPLEQLKQLSFRCRNKTMIPDFNARLSPLFDFNGFLL